MPLYQKTTIYLKTKFLILLFCLISFPLFAADKVTHGVEHHISIFQAIILGIIQGLSEFIPISSTAHLTVIPTAFGWGDPGVAFIAVLQLGSIVAILWFFRKDISRLTVNSYHAIKTKDYQNQDFRISLGIALGSIPIVIIGGCIKLFVKNFDKSPLRSLTSIAIVSIVMALLLALSEKLSKHKRDFNSLTLKDCIIVGLAQACAIIPGASRSGSTMTMALFIGLKRETAARFSFLLGIPAITLAGIVETKNLLQADSIIPLIWGLIFATISSYLAIAWLIKFLAKHNTWIFVWYRLAFGIIILTALLFKWIH